MNSAVSFAARFSSDILPCVLNEGDIIIITQHGAIRGRWSALVQSFKFMKDVCGKYKLFILHCLIFPCLNPLMRIPCYSQVPKYFPLRLFFCSHFCNSLLPGETDRDVFSCKCMCVFLVKECWDVSVSPGVPARSLWHEALLKRSPADVWLDPRRVWTQHSVQMWICGSPVNSCVHTLKVQRGREILTGVLGFCTDV